MQWDIGNFNTKQGKPTIIRDEILNGYFRLYTIKQWKQHLYKEMIKLILITSINKIIKRISVFTCKECHDIDCQWAAMQEM